MSITSCCTLKCDIPIDEVFWENRWLTKDTGWDIGYASPPLVDFIDRIENKNASILIPGCGNGYEAEYILSKGCTNLTLIEIAKNAVDILKEKFKGNKNIKIIHGDFFELNQKFDFILEQTFFCALTPYLRPRYVWKMFDLLNPDGKLQGLLFNKQFEKNPPFGGSEIEYRNLFHATFEIEKMQVAEKSIVSRAGTELEISLIKNINSTVNLYEFEGMTCNGCRNEVTEKLSKIDGVFNVNISSDFSEVLIVSEYEIDLKLLQDTVSYEEHYKIKSYKSLASK
jgi:methyl halide transferase